MLEMPVLETTRLLVRPFTMDDLERIHQILDIDLADSDLASYEVQPLAERREWLEWTVLNYRQLAQLYQPPYGDRAVVEKATDQVIGAVGFVPCLMPFEQIPGWSASQQAPDTVASTPEFGMYWAIGKPHQRRGYATEAARAMLDYAFHQLHLKQIVATTHAANLASIGVMRKLGMHIDRNPFPEPTWFQVVGSLNLR
jgi:RimJ/RimL family protein N-acetyltransferase